MLACLLGLLAGSPAAAGQPSVVLKENLGATFECGSGACLDAYRTLGLRHPDRLRPRDPQALEAELAAADALPLPPPLPLDPPALRAAVRDAVGVAFLFDDLERRQLTVTTIALREAGPYRERRVVFSDPEVGEFEAVVLEPPGRDRVAGIVGLHGHLDTPAVFAERYLGRELATAGYLVVVPQLRAMECLGPYGPELEISRLLLEQGFTLIGLRAYETALAAKYLRALPRVDPARIGLLSHSGGSSTAEVVVWLSDRFAVQVIDYHQDWRNRCGFFDTIHCETVPALFPLGSTLADDARAPLPRLRVDYGFPAPETRARILDWLEATLRGVVCPRLMPAACDGAVVPAALARRAEAACALAREAEAKTGRDRSRTLRRARARWRALALVSGRTVRSRACRVALTETFRTAARQSDLRTTTSRSPTARPMGARSGLFGGGQRPAGAQRTMGSGAPTSGMVSGPAYPSARATSGPTR